MINYRRLEGVPWSTHHPSHGSFFSINNNMIVYCAVVYKKFGILFLWCLLFRLFLLYLCDLPDNCVQYSKNFFILISLKRKAYVNIFLLLYKDKLIWIWGSSSFFIKWMNVISNTILYQTVYVKCELNNSG